MCATDEGYLQKPNPRPWVALFAPRIARMPGNVVRPARGRECLAFIADLLMFNRGEVLLATDGHPQLRSVLEKNVLPIKPARRCRWTAVVAF